MQSPFVSPVWRSPVAQFAQGGEEQAAVAYVEPLRRVRIAKSPSVDRRRYATVSNGRLPATNARGTACPITVELDPRPDCATTFTVPFSPYSPVLTAINVMVATVYVVLETPVLGLPPSRMVPGGLLRVAANTPPGQVDPATHFTTLNSLVLYNTVKSIEFNT